MFSECRLPAKTQLKHTGASLALQVSECLRGHSVCGGALLAERERQKHHKGRGNRTQKMQDLTRAVTQPV